MRHAVRRDLVAPPDCFAQQFQLSRILYILSDREEGGLDRIAIEQVEQVRQPGLEQRIAVISVCPAFVRKDVAGPVEIDMNNGRGLLIGFDA